MPPPSAAAASSGIAAPLTNANPPLARPTAIAICHRNSAACPLRFSAALRRFSALSQALGRVQAAPAR